MSEGAFGRFMSRLLGKAKESPRLPGVVVTTRWGRDDIEPTAERLREIIAELGEADPEHPDAWMTHEASGWTLALDEAGFARLGDSEGESERHLIGVTPERGLALWLAFAANGPDAVANESWAAGSFPPEILAARVAEAEAASEQSERAFYDSLGAERAAVPCRAPGCGRGAIIYSVFCRTHHCEQLWKRPCRFSH